MDNHKKVYLLLVIIIAILASIIVYGYVIRPFIDQNLIAAQNQGVGLTINAMLQQIQNQGYVAIPVGNQTLVLVPLQNQQQTSNAGTAAETTAA